MNKINRLESEGRFVQADIIRKIGAAKRKKRVDATGDSISEQILLKVREDISEILTDHNLPTAIFYVEKNADTALQSLKVALNKAIQEVLDKVMSSK